VVACAPTFPSGARITPSPIGGLIKISWNAASEPDANQEVNRYRIDVNGAQVANVNAPTTNCVLTGLAANTTYQLRVTAIDTANEASGPLTLSYTTPAAGNAGTTRACVPSTDTDGDRLPNAVETNTRVFRNSADTGTSPTVADTDVDGIKDGDETVGTTAGLNLYGMGTRPLRKNLLFEYDWFNDNNDSTQCASHSHRPTTAAISRLNTAFAAAPVNNPDGTRGITVINDYGQGGLFTGGTLVADANGNIDGGVNDAQFNAIKSANFASNRRGFFHYVLNIHRYATNSNSSGQAELPGNDLIVSLQCFLSTSNVANTIAHEVGHNLLLRHGGNVDLPNYKPNYNSVMNYRFQFAGVDTNCTPAGDGRLDYSTGGRASLNESSLSETAGICLGVDVDWNLNGIIDPGTVAVDLTQDGVRTVLTDFNDWANVQFGGVTQGDGAVPAPTIVTEEPVPVSAR
jgi:hypothetical protein